MKNEEVWMKVRRLVQGETIERKVLALRECCHREGNSIAIQNELDMERPGDLRPPGRAAPASPGRRPILMG